MCQRILPRYEVEADEPEGADYLLADDSLPDDDTIHAAFEPEEAEYNCKRCFDAGCHNCR